MPDDAAARRRGALSGVALVVYSLALLELGSILGLRFLTGEWLGSGALPPENFTGRIPVQDELERGGAQGRARAKDVILHPYLGFIRDRDRLLEGEDGPFLNVGFGGREPSLQARSAERLLVGVVGGSFASHFARNEKGIEGLRDALRDVPGLASKEIVLLPLAWGEYHQPQQVIALSYVLSMGGELDFLVNLDGFNELLVPAHYNVPNGVAGIYPMRWNLRLHQYLLDPELHADVGQIYYLADQRRRTAEALRASIFRYSFTAQIVWLALDRRREQALARVSANLEGHDSDATQYIFTGPWNEPASEATLLQDAVAVWRRASLQLRTLCEANGIAYVHLLQPNQYVPDSKPFGAEERELAVKMDSHYARWVRAGYPRLREAGSALSDRGVDFHDLTPMFRGIEEPVYRDPCCHLNERGEYLLGVRVGEIIARRQR